MNDDLQRALARQARSLAGPDPMEQHILLFKLSEALEHAPAFGDSPTMEAGTSQRQWLAKVGALLSRIDKIEKGTKFQTTLNVARTHWAWAIDEIRGQVADAIEELRLALELDGRSEIGTAYAPGQVYDFFKDLKSLVSHAGQEILLIDPYFDGQAFDAYLSSIDQGVSVRILADRYSKDVLKYAEKHAEQYATTIEVRRSKALHDRLMFIDRDECWIMGSSIKDAGTKATYLIPVGSEIADAKLQIYEAIWSDASLLDE